MKTLPANRQEWFRSVLRPFEAYTVVGFVIYQLLWASRGHPGVRDMAEVVVLGFEASALILALGGSLQLFFRPRAAAIPAFVFAASDAVFIICVIPDLVTA